MGIGRGSWVWVWVWIEVVGNDKVSQDFMKWTCRCQSNPHVCLWSHSEVRLSIWFPVNIYNTNTCMYKFTCINSAQNCTYNKCLSDNFGLFWTSLWTCGVLFTGKTIAHIWRLSVNFHARIIGISVCSSLFKRWRSHRIIAVVPWCPDVQMSRCPDYTRETLGTTIKDKSPWDKCYKVLLLTTNLVWLTNEAMFFV